MNPNTVTDATPTWLLVLVGVIGVLTVLNSWLHLIAKRTKNTVDDEVASYLDRLIAWLKKFSPLSTIAVVVAIGIAATVACTAQQIAGAKAFGQCEETAAVKDLEDTVKHILAAGVATWKQQLDALASAYGKDTLVCAVTNAEQFFSAKQGGDSVAPAAAERARAYLASAK